RHQDLAFQLQELLVADRLGLAIAAQRSGRVLVRLHRLDVEAAGVVDAAAAVGHGDDRGAVLAQEARRDAAGVAESLHRDPGPLESDLLLAARLADDELAAARGRLVAPLGAA